jgi:alkaline phosphatase D
MKTKLKRNTTLLIIGLLAFGQAHSAQKDGFKIVIGSCLHQDKPQPIWRPINQENADLFVLLGDNVYGDTEDMEILKAKYTKQWSQPGMQELLSHVPLIGIWDDHDFGQNDGGADYPQKEASRQVMLDVFKVAQDSPRRTREDGIYTSYIFGQAPHRVQIILPDLRWNRSPLISVSTEEYNKFRKPAHKGPYLPYRDTSKIMLGEKQWQWLKEQLRKPAEIRIFASSLQVLPEYSGWESWANFPHERQRLLDTLQNYHINNLVIVSGDTHWGELSKLAQQGHALWELTSSGLTETWHDVSPNIHRTGDTYAKANYAVLSIDWRNNPKIQLELKDVEGKTKIKQLINF